MKTKYKQFLTSNSLIFLRYAIPGLIEVNLWKGTHCWSWITVTNPNCELMYGQLDLKYRFRFDLEEIRRNFLYPLQKWVPIIVNFERPYCQSSMVTHTCFYSYTFDHKRSVMIHFVYIRGWNNFLKYIDVPHPIYFSSFILLMKNIHTTHFLPRVNYLSKLIYPDCSCHMALCPLSTYITDLLAYI